MSEPNSQDQQQQQHSPSPSGGGSPHYWCHHCSREVPIYMAPDPTCQLCNEQFIEEIDDVGDDPRAFLGGGATMGGENNNDGPSGEDDIFQFFRGAVGGGPGGGATGARFQFTTEDLNQQGGEGGNPMSAMLQSALSSILSGGGGTGTGTGNNNNNNNNTNTNNTNTENNNGQAGNGDTRTGDSGGTGEAGNPLGAMLQNVFSNVLSGGGGGTNGQASEGNRDNNNNEGENGGQQQQQQRRTPMIFYSGLVDGNMQFRPINLQGNAGEGGGQGQPGEDGGGVGANAFFQMGGTHHDGNETGNDTGGEGDGEGRNGPGNNIQGFLQLISALTGTPMDAGLAGNPNDYVFSQGALDNIITQLMEQTGGRTAPPPAPEDVIDNLPKRTLSEQEFKDQVDCAVCKDEFNQAESVIELPCQHLFHDDCIKPWLKVNGTCPVCRHSVLPIASTEGDGNDNNNDNNNINRSAQQQQQQQNSTTQSTDSSGQPATGNNSTGQSQPSSSSQRNNATSGSGAFAWFTSNPSSTSGSSSWPTNIPGAFTWGPGNNSTSNSRSQQPEENNDATPDMDLDLD